MVDIESYKHDLQQMLAATMAWHAANPSAKLVFLPLGCQEDTAMLRGLDPELINRVSGNAVTRELLLVMDAATGNRGTVIQAEGCIESVFGRKRVISGSAPPQARKMSPVLCPGCCLDLNSSGAFDTRKSRVGDFCICGHCASILCFNETMTLRLATPTEQSDLPSEIFRVVQSIKARRTREH